MMKRTTKIFIGLLLSGVLAAIATVVLPFFFSEGPQGSLLLKGKPVEVALSSFRVLNVWMETDTDTGIAKRNIYMNGNLTVLPAAGGKNVLTYPEEMHKYLSVAVKHDTLNLIFNLKQKNIPEKFKKKNWFSIDFQGIILAADSSLTTIETHRVDIETKVLNRKADSLSVSACRLAVDSCQLRTLFVRYAYEMNVKKSQITNLRLDLDGMNSWNVDQCEIETEYLTGSGQHRNNLIKGECRQMYWEPKNAEAELSVILKEKGCVKLE